METFFSFAKINGSLKPGDLTDFFGGEGVFLSSSNYHKGRKCCIKLCSAGEGRFHKGGFLSILIYDIIKQHNQGKGNLVGKSSPGSLIHVSLTSLEPVSIICLFDVAASSLGQGVKFAASSAGNE